MNRVILAMGTVLVLGCVEQPSSRSVAEPPRATVFGELAAAVKGALEAKRVEEDRLAQYAVEKQRLVSRLMPNGDWADGHPLAIEGYVSERDPEAATNLSVILDPEFMAGEAFSRRKKPLVLYIERPSEQKDRVKSPKTGPRIPNKTFQTAASTPGRGVAMAKNPEKSLKNGRDGCVLVRGGLKFLSVKVPISYQ